MRLLLEDESSALLLENASDTLLLESDYIHGYKKKRRVFIRYHDDSLEDIFGSDFDDSYKDLLSEPKYA
jgi:hypothetical protein